jgi:hypothetical protein
MTWTDWAAGVLNGIGAPINTTNIETLWAWSGAESGTADRMRWNNPLNSTLPWLSPPSHPMNSVGVQFYMDVPSGIAATVATLVNGYYPTICSHLRNSVPRASWGDACHELGTWGTGCGWLTPAYGPAPGSIPTPIPNSIGATVVASSGIAHAFGRGSDNALWTMSHDGNAWSPWKSLGGVLSNDEIRAVRVKNGDLHVIVTGAANQKYLWASRDEFATWSETDLAGAVTGLTLVSLDPTPSLLAAIAAIPAPSTVSAPPEPVETEPDLSPVTAALSVVNAKLDAIAAKLQKDLA